MALRTGILFVPQIDESASAAVIALLRRNRLPVIIVHETAVGNQRNWIEELLRRWCDEDELDLILTVGGTMPAPGPSQSEAVPGATATMIEREMVGFAERMRAHAYLQTPLALLHRGVCGIRGRTLMINLPNGAAAAALFLEAIAELIEPTLAYLQDGADRPQIEDELELVEDDEQSEAESQVETRMSQGKLNADEFARFLKRGDK